MTTPVEAMTMSQTTTLHLANDKESAAAAATSSWNQKEVVPMPLVGLLGGCDVVLGREGRNNRGNFSFRDLIRSYAFAYRTASKRGKTAIINKVVEQIYGCGGRFYKIDRRKKSTTTTNNNGNGRGGIFIELSKSNAHSKVQRCFFHSLSRPVSSLTTTSSVAVKSKNNNNNNGRGTDGKVSNNSDDLMEVCRELDDDEDEEIVMG